MLSENRRVSPVQEATYDGEGPEELLLTIGRRPRETHVRLGSKADVGPPLRLCPLYPRKRTSSDAMGMSALCHKLTFALQHHYSITSSANARSFSGTSSPSALAVLRLITSSTFVACSTGNSAGFSPLRILPA